MARACLCCTRFNRTPQGSGHCRAPPATATLGRSVLHVDAATLSGRHNKTAQTDGVETNTAHVHKSTSAIHVNAATLSGRHNGAAQVDTIERQCTRVPHNSRPHLASGNASVKKSTRFVSLMCANCKFSILLCHGKNRPSTTHIVYHSPSRQNPIRVPAIHIHRTVRFMDSFPMKSRGTIV